MRETIVLSIHDANAITRANAVLKNHGIVAFPTDTIYGVAAGAFSPAGIQKIYAAKERPDEKALPVLIGNFSQLEGLVLYISETVQKIAEAFWPGALTLILTKGPDVLPELSPFPTIGIRMPDLGFTRRLLDETGPLATTSANISGGANPTTSQDVLNQLGGRIDLILDGGETPGAAASTVVEVSGNEIKVLREGPISLAEIKSLFDGA